MTSFRYEAARQDGALVRGVVEAVTQPAAAALLSDRGLYPVLVEPSPPVPDTRYPFGLGRPSLRAQATVVQSLASLVEAGVPLQQALESTRRLAVGALGDALGRVDARVKEGRSLAAALAAEPGSFSRVTVGLVRAGEQGVGLGAALGQAAAQLERETDAAGRVRSALAYPALLAVVGSASVGLITLFVVPRFAALLGDVGQTLPVATQILLAASAVARHYGLLIAALIVVAAFAAARLIVERREAWHAWLLRWPIVGSLRHGLASARAARTLGALLGTGTPVLTALAVAGEAVGDAAVARRLASARDRVAEGASLSAALDATGALTPTAVQLAGVGERSGKLPTLLAKAADLDEQAAEQRLKALVALLEPSLILGFAALVAFVAAALLQAIYSLRPGGV